MTQLDDIEKIVKDNNLMLLCLIDTLTGLQDDVPQNEKVARNLKIIGFREEP